MFKQRITLIQWLLVQARREFKFLCHLLFSVVLANGFFFRFALSIRMFRSDTFNPAGRPCAVEG